MEYKFIKLSCMPSKNLKEAYGDNTNQVLKLVFQNDKEYIYYGLDFETIDHLMKADSSGKFFINHIRNNKSIEYKRIK